MATITSVSLELCRDLQNMDAYASNLPLLRELVLAAEARLAAIHDHVGSVRRACGMAGSSVVLSASVEG